MKLNTMMSKDIKTIGPGATLKEAAVLMKNESIGLLPVVEGQRLVGVLTDRDIVVRGLTTGSNDQHVRDIMTHNPVTVKPTDETKTAIKMMADHKIGRLILIDENKRPVGVVSATDIAAADSDAIKVRNLIGTLGKAHKNKNKDRPLTKV